MEFRCFSVQHRYKSKTKKSCRKSQRCFWDLAKMPRHRQGECCPRPCVQSSFFSRPSMTCRAEPGGSCSSANRGRQDCVRNAVSSLAPRFPAVTTTTSEHPPLTHNRVSLLLASTPQLDNPASYPAWNQSCRSHGSSRDAATPPASVGMEACGVCGNNS